MDTKWWKKAIAYQVYPKSFQDSNGDGIGDLKGITNRLPYLQELGIDLLWISPMFCSPMDDNGYDISDYYKVDPMFGTDADMERLLAKAEKKGIKVILDLVINHCSDEHAWFQKAIAEPESEEAGYFYFKETEDDTEPNNWRSNFGGSVWSRLKDGRWYYHTFSKKQPDLNWENKTLRKKLHDMINWWLEKGVAGFRVDAITFIKKDLSFASRETKDRLRFPVEELENYPGIHAFLSELKEQTFAKFDCVTVAEAPGVSQEEFSKYAGENGHFSMIFDFSWENMEQEEDRSSIEAVERWKKKIFDSQRFMTKNGWSANFLENHDQSRCVNKFLEEKDRSFYSASALATMYFFLHGTPFVYEGQEIGMTNAVWNSIDEMDDVRAKGIFQERTELGEEEDAVLAYFGNWGRDNARTPMQWDDSKNAGFTQGQPWLKVQENYKQCNVAAQADDSGSILSFYKKIIALHKSEVLEELLVNGSFAPVMEERKGLIAYDRVCGQKQLRVLVNFTGQSITVPADDMEMNVVSDNYNGLIQGGSELNLKPYQAVVMVRGI